MLQRTFHLIYLQFIRIKLLQITVTFQDENHVAQRLARWLVKHAEQKKT